MNREIKFRAWDKNLKKMIDWSWFVDNQVCEMFDNEDLIVMQYTGLTDKRGKEIYCGDILKGTRIRDKGFSVAGEGNRWDIRKRVVTKDVVRFGNGSFCWGYISFKKFDIGISCGKDCYWENRLNKLIINEKMIAREWTETYNNFEVIGNIYENPELLKN